MRLFAIAAIFMYRRRISSQRSLGL